MCDGGSGPDRPLSGAPSGAPPSPALLCRSSSSGVPTRHTVAGALHALRLAISGYDGGAGVRRVTGWGVTWWGGVGGVQAAQLRASWRGRQGAVNIDTPDVEVQVSLNSDDSVRDIDLVTSVRHSPSQTLVAEMMILTGQVIGEYGAPPSPPATPVAPSSLLRCAIRCNHMSHINEFIQSRHVLNFKSLNDGCTECSGRLRYGGVLQARRRACRCLTEGRPHPCCLLRRPWLLSRQVPPPRRLLSACKLCCTFRQPAPPRPELLWLR